MLTHVNEAVVENVVGEHGRLGQEEVHENLQSSRRTLPVVLGVAGIIGRNEMSGDHSSSNKA